MNPAAFPCITFSEWLAQGASPLNEAASCKAEFLPVPSSECL